MEKQPKKIKVCNLQCVVMPQGEIICLGKIIGWFEDFKAHLEAIPIEKNHANEN